MKKQRGFAMLLEMLISLIVMLTILAMALPNPARMRAAQNQVAARKRVEAITQAQIDIGLCASSQNCNPNTTTAAQNLIPVSGSTFQMSGYSFVFVQNGNQWTYTANPISNQTGVYSYFSSQDGVVRCVPNAVANVSTSPCS